MPPLLGVSLSSKVVRTVSGLLCPSDIFPLEFCLLILILFPLKLQHLEGSNDTETSKGPPEAPLVYRCFSSPCRLGRLVSGDLLFRCYLSPTVPVKLSSFKPYHEETKGQVAS